MLNVDLFSLTFIGMMIVRAWSINLIWIVNLCGYGTEKLSLEEFYFNCWIENCSEQFSFIFS